MVACLRNENKLTRYFCVMFVLVGLGDDLRTHITLLTQTFNNDSLQLVYNKYSYAQVQNN